MKIRTKSVSRTNLSGQPKTHRIQSDDYEIMCHGNHIILRSGKPYIDGEILRRFFLHTTVEELRKIVEVSEMQKKRLTQQRSFVEGS